MFRRTPERKRKRAIKRFMVMSITCIVLLVIVGGTAYYVISAQRNKPLYISPLGKPGSVGHESTSSLVNEDDSMTVLKKHLKEKQIEFDSVTASGSAYIANLKNGGKVIFSSEKALIPQVSSLQFILSRLTMEGKLFSQLDLRFDKPIIRE